MKSFHGLVLDFRPPDNSFVLMRIADGDRKCDILKTVIVFLLDVWLCICSRCWIGTLAEVMME